MKMLLIVLSSVWAIQCPFVSLDARVLQANTVPFLPKTGDGFGSYLQQNIPFEFIKPYFEAINSTFGPLKSRGESHITTITPPEFSILKSKISIQEINEIALNQDIQSMEYSIICLARQSPTESAFTYNLLVDSPKLFHLRQIVQEEFESRGGSGFDSSFFFPHITLGFETRDYFVSDGIFKNSTTCICPVPIQ
jgi:hypothetical protein